MRKSPRGCPRTGSASHPRAEIGRSTRPIGSTDLQDAPMGTPCRRGAIRRFRRLLRFQQLRICDNLRNLRMPLFPRSALRLEVLRPARHRGTGGGKRPSAFGYGLSERQDNRSPPRKPKAKSRKPSPLSLAVSVHPMQLTPGAPARPAYHDCPVRWIAVRCDRSRIPASGTSGQEVIHRLHRLHRFLEAKNVLSFESARICVLCGCSCLTALLRGRSRDTAPRAYPAG